MLETWHPNRRQAWSLARSIVGIAVAGGDTPQGGATIVCGVVHLRILAGVAGSNEGVGKPDAVHRDAHERGGRISRVARRMGIRTFSLLVVLLGRQRHDVRLRVGGP